MKEIYQSDTITIKRSQIEFNPLNPKHHSEEAIRLQKRNIEQKGFFGGILWNDVTGHIVSGHRRTEALDLIHRYNPEDPSTDYDIKVEHVSLTEKEEKEQMTFMSGVNDTRPDFNLIADYIDDVDYKNIGISEEDYKTILDLRDFDEAESLIDIDMPSGIAEMRRELFYSNSDEVLTPDRVTPNKTVQEATEEELLENPSNGQKDGKTDDLTENMCGKTDVAGEKPQNLADSGKNDEETDEDDEELADEELKKNITKINKEFTQDVAAERQSKLSLVGVIRFADEDEKRRFCEVFVLAEDFQMNINAKDLIERWENPSL